MSTSESRAEGDSEMGEGKIESGKLYVAGRKSCGCKWYTIDTVSGETRLYKSMNYDEETDKILPTPIDSGCAMIETKIYIVGGQYWDPIEDEYTKQRSKAVIIFDTITEQWIREVSYHMNTDRAKPLLVPFKYDTAIRLLVFGGCSGRADVWCESFDIATCKWTPLAQPPNVVKQHKTFCGYARVGDALVLWNKFLFCIYHVDTNKWSEDVCLLEYNFEGTRGRTFRGPSSVAVYDKVLFWYYGEQLHGYDLSLTRWIKTPLCTYDQQQRTPSFDCGEHLFTSLFLVTVGKENLAVVWADPREKYHACNWTTFQTSTNPRNRLLHATPAQVFPTGIPNNISHVLTAYQPAIEDCWSENEGNIVDSKFIRDLSSTMYMESYLSFSRHRDVWTVPYPESGHSDDDNDFDQVECESSVDPLPLLKLDKDSAAIMRKIIDKNALKYYEEEDFKCLERDPAK